MCAVKELQLLGMRFEPEYLQALRRTAAAGPRRRHEVAREVESTGAEREWNQDFVSVAGYTEAGVRFGVTREEFETLSEGEDVPIARDDQNA